MRHDSYTEDCWAVWPKDGVYQGGACWDTPEEAANREWAVMAYPKNRYRLVRLHRVTIEDVVASALFIGIDTTARRIDSAMAQLGVSLTERWVAAEERPVEEEGGIDFDVPPRDPDLARLIAAWKRLTPYRQGRTIEYAETMLRELREVEKNQ